MQRVDKPEQPPWIAPGLWHIPDRCCERALCAAQNDHSLGCQKNPLALLDVSLVELRAYAADDLVCGKLKVGWELGQNHHLPWLKRVLLGFRWWRRRLIVAHQVTDDSSQRAHEAFTLLLRA
jgi:hypothetical protein